VNGYKDIENRSWKTRHRGPLLIHAGTSRARVNESTRAEVLRKHGIHLPETFDFGGVIGMVDVIDCRKRTDSPWHYRGAIGWVLTRPRRLAFRPCKGALNLFEALKAPAISDREQDRQPRVTALRLRNPFLSMRFAALAEPRHASASRWNLRVRAR
jgi:hypothetical protein